MSRIIRRKLGDPISAESMDEIRRLAEMPDELINTEDISERPISTGRRVQPVPDVGRVQAEQRKAS